MSESDDYIYIHPIHAVGLQAVLPDGILFVQGDKQGGLKPLEITSKVQ